MVAYTLIYIKSLSIVSFKANPLCDFTSPNTFPCIITTDTSPLVHIFWDLFNEKALIQTVASCLWESSAASTQNNTIHLGMHFCLAFDTFCVVLYKAWNMLTHGMQQCLQIYLNTAATDTGTILQEHYLVI